MDPRTELGEFLKSRRARLSPEDAGLRDYGGRRRVPGLRREELAQLAGISADYYVRLEQGRLGNVSDEVLDAVARALRLDEAERTHLHNLAQPRRTRRRAPRPQLVRPGLRRLLDTMDGTPAYLLGRRIDLLAWNKLGAALLGGIGPGPHNMARMVFADPAAEELFLDWEEKARGTVAYLRLDAGRHPDDPELATLVGELSVKSPDFRRLWAEQDVREKTNGTMQFRNPIVGILELDFEALRLTDDPDQVLVTYTAEPGSPSAAALGLLASWTHTTAETPSR